MKAWKVHDANWDFGWLLFAAETRSKARVMYMRELQDIDWYDLTHAGGELIRAIRYPTADAARDTPGLILDFDQYLTPEDRDYEEREY